MASKKKVGALVGKAKPPTKSEIISQIADKTSSPRRTWAPCSTSSTGSSRSR
jgi:hypothetical protein